MLIVTGASGQLGRKIVDKLMLTTPAHRIGVSVRDPSKVADLQGLGVRVRHGDYSDEGSLRHAWEGAERLLLISSNAAATGGDPLAQHATALRAANKVGVTRIFYTSHVASAATSRFPPARHHAATEQMLAQSGLAWTALRHGFYADSGLSMNARGLAAGEIVGPEDGPVAWTTHDDLAAADAALLTSDTVIDGPTPPLTAGEAFTLEELAAIASEASGRPMTRRIVSEQDFEQGLLTAGVPERAIAIISAYYAAAHASEFATVDPMLEALLGRPPVSMRAVIAERLRT